ncbi:phosphotransferase [Nocardioides sp. dk4132]|uniref:phosphotransferase n=1 Tax=unclassified Nocardioides TaxID=2615069 RepID=UPI001295B14D|nr:MULTISPECIES: phosphotransferase [unclassified Nocardioides]MQW75086.1 phosphotransferase [Nocardioides sp. dk4132]QGA07745.1 phosphotransferase [Nocardioides sp. dk884]
MWQPEPGWQPLPGGTGTSTLGVWRARLGGQQVVVKRLLAPAADDPAALSQPRHAAYWRREADAALSGLVEGTPGLRMAPTAVEEDAEGITLVQESVADARNTGLFLARALGRFAASDVRAPWLASDQLRDRVLRVERYGGWRTLARTPVADVAEHLWTRRGSLLDSLDALPQVLQHGDPVPGNLLGRREADVLALDWGTLGTGPVGGDLGYYLLSARESLEPLLDAYCEGLGPGTSEVGRSAAAHGARVTAVLTALNRAEWALARVAGGEGALAGKYRHPAVAPHLQALQRQFPLIEELLGSGRHH